MGNRTSILSNKYKPRKSDLSKKYTLSVEDVRYSINDKYNNDIDFIYMNDNNHFYKQKCHPSRNSWLVKKKSYKNVNDRNSEFKGVI